MKIWPWLRKALVVAAGVPLVLLGFVMIPLPGPGLLVIVGGLFVLSLEFDWAKRHLAYARSKLTAMAGSLGSFRTRWRKSRESAAPRVERIGTNGCHGGST